MCIRPITLLALTLSTSLTAQLEPDAKDQLRRVEDKVAAEMQAIDKLLTERNADAAKAASQRASEGIQKMLEQAATGNKRVQQGIDELIEQLKSCGL